MNADLYGAWLAAGNRLQPAGEWLAGHWTGLAALGLAAAILTVLVWAFRGDDYRTRNDKRAARRTAGRLGEDQEPGTDIGLYLDAVAIYDDCDDLDRLRNAINQHRKEERP